MKYLFMCFLIIPVCESYGIQNHPIMSGFEEDQKKGKSSDPDSSYIYKKILTNEILKRDIAMTTSDIEKWNYSIHNLSHRRRSFEWQLLSSRFIFFIVMFVVICGIIFSGLQFYQSWKMSLKFMNMANSKNLEQIEKLLEQEDSQITVSPSNGVSITTSVVGFLVLCVSICFFYLYLQHVYPINEAQIDNLRDINYSVSSEAKD
jgi:hypothetical protein